MNSQYTDKNTFVENDKSPKLINTLKIQKNMPRVSLNQTSKKL